MIKTLLQGRGVFPAQHVLKAYYFSFFGALVCLFPYFNVYFASRGFTEHQIGVLTSVRPWVAAVAGNTLSALADAFHCHRLVFLMGYVFSILLRCALGAVDSYSAALVLVILSSIASEPSSVLADTAAMSLAVKEDDFGRARLWGAIGWGGISPFCGLLIDKAGIHAAFYAYGALATLCCVPALCMDLSHVRGSGRGGRQEGCREGCREGAGHDGRMSSTHSNNRMSDSNRMLDEHRYPDMDCIDPEESKHLVTHAAADDYENDNTQDDTHDDAHNDTRDTHGAHDTRSKHGARMSYDQRGLARDEEGCAHDPGRHNAPPLWRTLWTLMTADMLLFMAQALTMGIGVGTMDGYLFLLLQQHGASGLLMSVSLTIACIAEIPLFHYSGSLLRTLGVDCMLHLVLLAFVLRLLAYACVPWYPSVWLVLPVEVLHAATFACAWSAGLWKSRLISPPGAEATVQAIFQGLYMGLGHGIGGLVGGLVWRRWHGGAAGLQAVFVCATIVIASSWACISVLQAWAKWGRRGGARQGWRGALVDVSDDVELVGT